MFIIFFLKTRRGNAVTRNRVWDSQRKKINAITSFFQAKKSHAGITRALNERPNSHPSQPKGKSPILETRYKIKKTEKS